MRWALLLSVAVFGVADMVAFSGAHLTGLGNFALEQVDALRTKADEMSREPV